MSKVLCDIYKSRKKDETYLYVTRADGLTKVPEALLEQFGTPVLAMTMIITPEKKFARVEASRVLEQMQQNGFYLQIPPPKEIDRLDLFCKIDKS
jgi:uncharacterized protein